MGNLVSRKARIFNNCPDQSIRLEIIHDPGNFLLKKITIPPGRYTDISYGIVDNSYNQGRSKNIRIWREEEREYEREIIGSTDVRDCENIILTLVQDGDDRNKMKVHVERVKGNYFRRIRISWMLRDLVGT